ncbi:MAG: hypothetical protein ACYDES_08855 [Acidimicrobiales bacterium]
MTGPSEGVEHASAQGHKLHRLSDVQSILVHHSHETHDSEAVDGIGELSVDQTQLKGAARKL